MAVPNPKSPSRTLRGVVRERLSEIERQMQLGYRHHAIVESLAADGYSMTVDVFRNALYQARRRARGKRPVDVGVAPSPAARPTQTSAAVGTKSIALRRQSPSVGSMPKDTAKNLLEQFQELARAPRPGEPDKLIGTG
jgi:hypothetical protein